MPHPNPSLLSSHFRHAHPLSAWRLFLHMHRSGNAPLNSYTLTPLLTASSLLLDLHKGTQAHALLIKTGSDSGIIPTTALLDMYSKCDHSMANAILVFQLTTKDKDVIAWNTLLSGFVRHGFPGKAVGVFKAMQEKGVEFSGSTLTSLIKGCALMEALRPGKQIHGLLIVTRQVSTILATALVDFYSTCGLLSDAMEVFDNINSTKDEGIYNALISACVRNKKYEEAFAMIRGMSPNGIAVTTLITACSELLDLSKGKQIHCVVIRRCFSDDTLVYNALLDMYAKCGKITTARMVFHQISIKDVISWTSIIDAYGSHGCGAEALKLFKEMGDVVVNNVSPNPVTFLAVISACGHSGLVEEARDCFVSMREKHGIEPGPEHYACLIYILGRAQLVEEAWDVFYDIKRSNIKPTAAVLVALLNTCKVNLDTVRGEFAAKCLFELEPDKPGNYVLLSNFYASVGNWERVEELRRELGKKGLRKKIGSSWIPVE